jgi:hypothetical protein
MNDMVMQNAVFLFIQPCYILFRYSYVAFPALEGNPEDSLSVCVYSSNTIQRPAVHTCSIKCLYYHILFTTLFVRIQRVVFMGTV